MFLVDAVKELSTTVKDVKKPRQKQAKWILVEFETNEHAEDFKKLLIEKKEIEKLYIKPSKLNIKFHDPLNKSDSSDRQQYTNSLTKQTFTFTKVDKYSNRLMVSNLPESVTKTEIAELFPGHMKIDLKLKPKVRAFVEYSSVKEAMTARAQVRPILNGQKIRVILLLLDDGNRKRKISDSETTESTETKIKDSKKSQEVPKKKQKTNEKPEKSQKKHQFVRPLRYFENAIE